MRRTTLTREDRDRGFTLIELLVVIIIIGILAAIAIPVFLNQRKKGYAASAVADVRNVGSFLEGTRTDSSNYPASLSANAAEAVGAKMSPGNEVAKYTRASNGDAFKVCVVHKVGTTVDAFAVYDSVNGGVVAKGTGTGGSDCAGAPPALVNGVPCGTITYGQWGKGSGGTSWQQFNINQDPAIYYIKWEGGQYMWFNTMFGAATIFWPTATGLDTGANPRTYEAYNTSFVGRQDCVLPPLVRAPDTPNP